MNGKSRKGTDTKEGTTTNQPRNGATRKGVSVIGSIGGFVSIEHGIFEMLQGNAPTGGMIFEAIGPAWRFSGGVGEMALSLVPNFLITGIIACLIGIFTIIWATAFSGRKHWALGLFCLSILSLLFGGGIAFFMIALVNSMVATRVDKPMTGWKRRIPGKPGMILAGNWSVMLAFFVALFAVTLTVAIFGLPFVGIRDVNQVAVCMGLSSLALYSVSVLACFLSDAM